MNENARIVTKNNIIVLVLLPTSGNDGKKAGKQNREVLMYQLFYLLWELHSRFPLLSTLPPPHMIVYIKRTENGPPGGKSRKDETIRDESDDMANAAFPL